MCQSSKSDPRLYCMSCGISLTGICLPCNVLPADMAWSADGTLNMLRKWLYAGAVASRSRSVKLYRFSSAMYIPVAPAVAEGSQSTSHEECCTPTLELLHAPRLLLHWTQCVQLTAYQRCWHAKYNAGSELRKLVFMAAEDACRLKDSD